MSKINTRQKCEKFMKCAQNKRCTSSICVQSLGKVSIKKMKLLELQITQTWHPKVLRTDGRTDGRAGPTTRPAFAKVTKVKILFTCPGTSINKVNAILYFIF